MDIFSGFEIVCFLHHLNFFAGWEFPSRVMIELNLSISKIPKRLCQYQVIQNMVTGEGEFSEKKGQATHFFPAGWIVVLNLLGINISPQKDSNGTFESMIFPFPQVGYGPFPGG